MFHCGTCVPLIVKRRNVTFLVRILGWTMLPVLPDELLSQHDWSVLPDKIHSHCATIRWLTASRGLSIPWTRVMLSALVFPRRLSVFALHSFHCFIQVFFAFRLIQTGGVNDILEQVAFLVCLVCADTIPLLYNVPTTCQKNSQHCAASNENCCPSVYSCYDVMISLL